MTRGHYEWYRWVMPMFLHAGFLHPIFNLAFSTILQLIIGAILEKILTLYRTCAIYLVSGYI